MSKPAQPRRARCARIALASGFALAGMPAIAHAAPVDLGTAGPFVVLGGSTVTNTGASVLNGDLGVSPGTALVGFGSPAVVNGATHANDAVAQQAQADLTTAYDVAAAQPVPPANDLTGTDLGSRTLIPGAYRYTSSAQLTGALTLDAQGDPAAQFVFEIGSTLTTASASSVVLTNGASPCNVFWQVGSSATLDTDTAFQGTVMALTDITLNARASVVGRMLARNGQVSLIQNTLGNSGCRTGSSTPPTGQSTPTGPTGAGPTPVADDSRPTSPPPGGVTPSRARPAGPGTGTATFVRGPRARCTDGFSATVRGRRIRRVDFSLDGRRIARRSASPFTVFVRATPGAHRIRARVTFTDATRARTLSFRYRACAVAALRPRRGPSQFTG